MSRDGSADVAILALILAVVLLIVGATREHQSAHRLQERVACLEAIAGGSSQMPPTRGCLP